MKPIYSIPIAIVVGLLCGDLVKGLETVQVLAGLAGALNLGGLILFSKARSR